MTAPAALASEGRFVLVINGRIEVKVRSFSATVSGGCHRRPAPHTRHGLDDEDFGCTARTRPLRRGRKNKKIDFVR